VVGGDWVGVRGSKSGGQTEVGNGKESLAGN
jgi:hypothetical protein